MDEPFPLSASGAVLALFGFRWADEDPTTGTVLPFLVAWLLSVLAALFRAALEHCSRTRLIDPVNQPAAKARLERALDQEERIEAALALIQISCEAWCILALAVNLTGSGFTVADHPHSWAFAFALVLLFPTVHVMPRGIMARGHAEVVLRPSLPTLRLLALFFLPATLPLLKLSGRAGKLLRTRTDHEKEHLTDDIIDAVEESERAGALEENEAQMIESVLDLQDLRVGEIMTPRTDLTTVSVEATVEEAVRIAHDSGHSKVPVFRTNRDEICGIFHLRDAIPHLLDASSPTPKLEDILVPACFVPDTKKVSQLLREFQQNQQSMAIVLDEYGGTEGLITVEDILEEIVGDLREPHDQEEGEWIQLLEPGSALVDPRVRIDEINDELEVNIPSSDDYDTLGGFVYAHLDRVPLTDEVFVSDGVEFKVVKVEDRRISRLQLRSLEAQSEAANGSA